MGNLTVRGTLLKVMLLHKNAFKPIKTGNKMATLKELYNQPIQGYWENKITKHIYLFFQGTASDNQQIKERTHWNAGAINLRTGKSRKLRLEDFVNLQRLDSEIESLLEENISINSFYQSYQNHKN